jgi:pseudouridylate synthase
MSDDHIGLSREVSEALASNQAVVTLESTVIAQGLPWPANFETALAVHAAVRGAGVAPATIAVLEGSVRIGLTESELLEFASSAAQLPEIRDGNRPHLADGRARHPLTKANRRDLGAVVARRGSAAMTVSATLWIAGRFGLNPRVLATGGLGGVHRGAATTFDVSTDLDELARADGALIVCSGFKSILDVPATLEALETRGVLVVGYCTDELPGFLSHSTGLPLEHRVETPDEAAAIVRAHRRPRAPGRDRSGSTGTGRRRPRSRYASSGPGRRPETSKFAENHWKTAHSILARLDPAVHHRPKFAGQLRSARSQRSSGCRGRCASHLSVKQTCFSCESIPGASLNHVKDLERMRISDRYSPSRSVSIIQEALTEAPHA